MSAASIAPAPNPAGTADTQNHHIESERENPNSAAAVTSVETAVTAPVPNLFMSFAEKKDDDAVQSEIITVTKLA